MLSSYTDFSSIHAAQTLFWKWSSIEFWYIWSGRDFFYCHVAYKNKSTEFDLKEKFREKF